MSFPPELPLAGGKEGIRFFKQIAVFAFALVLTGSAALTREDSTNASESTIYYVSPRGDNSWSGLLAEPNASQTDGPFATIEKARDSIRIQKSQDPLTRPVKVYLRGGRYFLNRPFVLRPEDSGTEDYPITYAAYPGEHPVLSGGRPIKNWIKSDKGVWKAIIPDVGSGEWYFRQLWVNGSRKLRARLPKQGFYRIDGLPGVDASTPINTPSDKFLFKPGDIKESWTNRSDIEAIVFTSFVDANLPIATIDEFKREVTFTRKSRFRLTNNHTLEGARYYLENIAEALQDPGEWYLDRATGSLYYIPNSDEDMTVADVIAPKLDFLVRIEGRPENGSFLENVIFSGLSFSHTEWQLPVDDAGDTQGSNGIPGAFFAQGMRQCTIQDCTFIHLGSYALELSFGCTGNWIDGNKISQIAAGGIHLSGGDLSSPETMRNGANRITNNSIFRVGQIYHGASGILLRHTTANAVSHNEIYKVFHSGISVGWVWGYFPSVSHYNIIEYNDIHDIGRGLMPDLGAIYLLGDSSGTVVRNNRIYNVNAWDFGGWGIYLDEGCSRVLIEKNLVYRAESGAFHIHYGRDNNVRNNIFAFSREGQIIRSLDQQVFSLNFERNIVYFDQGPVLGKLWNDGAFRFDRNLYYRSSAGPISFSFWTFEQWQRRGQDPQSFIENPLFADPQNGDFRFLKGSPSTKINFEPIDFDSIGPVKK